LNRFFLSTDLINLVGYLLEVFAIRYMMKYFLLLHIFQTTSGNARWGQPWLIQPKSFPKQVSGWMFLYAMFL